MRFSPLGSPRRWAGVLIFGVLLATLGCGGSQGKVSGTVTYKGQPLKGGKVSFVTSAGDKKAAVADCEIDESGKYSVSRLPPGEYKICVETESFKPNEQQLMMAKTRPKDAKGGVDIEARAKRYTPIPAEYGNPDTTPEKIQVKSGSQTRDIEIK